MPTWTPPISPFASPVSPGAAIDVSGAASPEGRIRAADARSARLLELRARLTAVAAEVERGHDLLPGENPSWRSAAARAYQGRLDEVRTCLHSASAQLDEALGRISSRLAAVAIERRSAETELAARRSMALLHQEAAAGESRRYR